MTHHADDGLDARAMIQEAEVMYVDDTGQAQVATVMKSNGSVYHVEVVQSFGSANVTPADGAVALLFCLGGDPANMRAFVYNPSTRMGNLKQGEQAIYSADGTRVHVAQAGVINIVAGNTVNVTAPNAVVNAKTSVAVTTKQATISAGDSLTIDSPLTTFLHRVTINEQLTLGADLDMTGDLSVAGNVAVTGGVITVDGVTVVAP